MKINLVNDNQLQIIVTRHDMLDRDMRSLFRDIIEQARLQFGFDVRHNTSLMVEAYPLSEESMILTITKVSADEIDFTLFMHDEGLDEPWAVFEFQSLDDCINLAQLVHEGADSDSALYKWRERYQLYVDDVNGIAEDVRGHFMEFGDMSMLTREYLDEHGTLMIGAQALQVLGKL